MADQSPSQGASREEERRQEWHQSALQAGYASFITCPGASMLDGIEAAVRAYLTSLSRRGQLDARALLEHYVKELPDAA